MNLEQAVLDKLRALPPEKQQEVLDFAEFLQQKNIPKRSLKSVKGLCADLEDEYERLNSRILPEL